MGTDAKPWRAVLLEAGFERGVGEVVEIVVRALADGLPLLREDADLLDLARRSAVGNLESLLRLVQEEGDAAIEDLEPAPAAMAFARELARRHVPIVELGRSYRVAQHALWQWAVAELRSRIEDPALVAVAVEELSDAAFRTGDVFGTLVMEGYAVERERWMRSGEAVREAAVTELLAGGAVDVAAMSGRLGYELRQDHQAFVVWGEVDDGVAGTAAVQVGGGRALVVRLGDGLVAGWAPPAAVAPAALAAATADPARARVALGAPASGLAGFRAGHREALEARRVVRLLGAAESRAVVRHEDVALLALLTQDLHGARVFVRATLGPLAEDDAAARRLADTLRVLLEERESPRRAGHRLGVHENTVAKRQAAIDRALPAATRAGAAELLAALVLLDAVR